jgi:hypothetical protein
MVVITIEVLLLRSARIMILITRKLQTYKNNAHNYNKR